jgi:hypothetical protein
MPVKRVSRDPLRFDTFSLFAHHLQKAGLPLHQRSAQRRFLDAVKASTRAALASDTFVHEQRTEALFEMVVASLGAVRLLKKEDEGAVFHILPHPVQPPDFRLILSDGSQALVEVKNHHQAEGFGPYVFRRAEYVASACTR